MSPSRKFIPSDVGTCSSLMPLSSTNATAGFTLEQKKMSQGVRTVPSLPATRAKKDRISEAGFGFWVPIYVVPNTRAGLARTFPKTHDC